MSIILNIGLAHNGNSNLCVGAVLIDLANNFGIIKYAIHHSDTEMTVVAELESLGNVVSIANSIFHLADIWGQDCVATYNCSTGNGALIGPRSDKWGSFNPDYFLLLDGSRLSQPTKEAA